MLDSITGVDHSQPTRWPKMPASFHLDKSGGNMEGVRQGTEFPEALASCPKAAVGGRGEGQLERGKPVRGATVLLFTSVTSLLSGKYARVSCMI